MKSIRPLFLLVLFISSCALYRDNFTVFKQRIPASLGESEQRMRFYSAQIRYILNYCPKTCGSLGNLINNPSKLYKILGEIDLQRHEFVPSPLFKKDGIESLIKLRGASQISFSRWNAMMPKVLESFFSGRHVFYDHGAFYTIWGTQLSIGHIDQSSVNFLLNLNPRIEARSFALSVFNNDRAFEYAHNKFLLLPELRALTLVEMQRIKNDFTAQMGNGHDVSVANLIMYSPKSYPYTIDGFENYYDEKYKRWMSFESLIEPSEFCDLKIYLRSISHNETAMRYIKTLIDHKAQLVQVLNLSNNDYDELAVLSIGILSVESKMGASFKYFLKEEVTIGSLNLGQMGISLLKRLRGRDDGNSRGLTQIKDIGPHLEDTSYAYLENADLNEPENAALATMFVLKEKLGYLRHFSDRHNNITQNNWADYLYYFYQGASSQITGGDATPPLNLRIQKILELKEKTMIFRSCH